MQAGTAEAELAGGCTAAANGVTQRLWNSVWLATVWAGGVSGNWSAVMSVGAVLGVCNALQEQLQHRTCIHAGADADKLIVATRAALVWMNKSRWSPHTYVAA